MFHTNILAVMSFADCRIPNYLLTGFPILLCPSSSALFFLRVKAVYGNNRIITALFGSLWVVLFGFCLALPVSVHAFTNEASLCHLSNRTICSDAPHGTFYV